MRGGQLQIISQTTGFTVGICATGSSENLPALLSLVSSEKFDDRFTLRKIIVVASGCPEGTVSKVRLLSKDDTRIHLIEESERHGKADAVNKIILNSTGDYIVFVNADALPTRGSITKLLEAAERSESIGVVSGRAFLDPGLDDTTSMVEELMWSIHNESSLELNHMNVSNHGSDEMMVIRSRAIPSFLPDGVINDGAYLGGTAKSLGYSIKFCGQASVMIDAPGRVPDLIRQRERIIFGHFQIWKLRKSFPKTVESLLLSSPGVSLGIVVRSLSERPNLIKIAPIALFIEAISFLLAVKDTATSSSQKHRIWKRYAS
jgi:cellulose synthase/poly-beta-1,6-N-acetylglucosamine synthase-like glycosyltransferase